MKTKTINFSFFGKHPLGDSNDSKYDYAGNLDKNIKKTFSFANEVVTLLRDEIQKDEVRVNYYLLNENVIQNVKSAINGNSKDYPITDHFHSYHDLFENNSRDNDIETKSGTKIGNPCSDSACAVSYITPHFLINTLHRPIMGKDLYALMIMYLKGGYHFDNSIEFYFKPGKHEVIPGASTTKNIEDDGKKRFKQAVMSLTPSSFCVQGKGGPLGRNAGACFPDCPLTRDEMLPSLYDRRNKIDFTVILFTPGLEVWAMYSRQEDKALKCAIETYMKDLKRIEKELKKNKVVDDITVGTLITNSIATAFLKSNTGGLPKTKNKIDILKKYVPQKMGLCNAEMEGYGLRKKSASSWRKQSV